MAIESWSEIQSFPGLLASSQGRIMVDPYVFQMPNGGERIRGGEPTHGVWDGKRFIYRIRGRCVKVHRLVCEAFNGPPEPGQVCMHLNENSADNRPENLAWGTQKENLNAPGFIAYCKSRTGEAHPRAKRTT
jgi:hypothetical protein